MSEEAGKKGRGLVLSLLATALVGGGTACAVSWLDPFGEGAAAGEAPADDAPAEVPPAAILTLDPIVVSLTGTEGARRRAPRLRVVVALETDEDTAARTARDDARLRDGFTAAARTLGAETLAGAGGLEALRDAYLDRARDVLGEDAVSGVLVTDYVLT